MIFFNNWAELSRIVLVGVLAYMALILLLRVSGKRTLSKLNAFDLVITVAIGSTFATILLSKDVSLAEGVTAFALLIFLQFAITWLSVRFAIVGRLVKDEPRLLYYRGDYLHGALKAERVTEVEVLQAMRSQGVGALDLVEAVVLETDGSLNVITQPAQGRLSVLSNVVKQ